MNSRLRLAFLSLLVGLVLACSSGDGGAGGDPPPTTTPPPASTEIAWKPGSTVLFAPSGVDAAVDVQDAVRDGSRVLVLFTHSAGHRLAISDDLGTTFRSVDLPGARAMGVELVASVTQDLFVLHPWSGRVFLFVRGVRAADSVPFWQVMEVDLSTGHYAGTARLPFGMLFPRGSTVTSYTAGSGATPVASAGRIDLSTGLTEQHTAPYALSSGLCLGTDWVSTDGQTFSSRCDVALPEPGLCLLQATATAPAPSGKCFPRGFYPAPVPGGGGFLRPLAGGGLREIFWLSRPAEQVDVFATTLTPGTPPGISGPLFVAHSSPGSPRAGFVDRETLGGLIPVSADGVTLGASRLLSFDGSATRQVSLSRTACADDSRCFTATASNALPGIYGTLIRALSLGGDDWLAIHKVRDDQNRPNRVGTIGPWDDLVVRRETAAPQLVSDPAPQPTASPLPGFPSSLAGSALEAVCARMVTCFPNAQWPAGGKVDLRQCVANWLSVGTGNPAADGAYQRFLATPDCASFHDTWPEVVGPRVATCGCQGNVAVTCPGGRSGPVLDCQARGLSCILDPSGRATCAAPYTVPPACNACDPAHRATTCLAATPTYVVQTDCSALGLACGIAPVSGPVCTATAPVCTSVTSSPTCDGNVAYTCVAPGVMGSRQDCTRTGQVCQLGAGCVTQPVTPPGCGVPGEQCQGRYLAYCLGGRAAHDGPVRYLDCGALGYRTCAMKADPVEPHATCAP